MSSLNTAIEWTDRTWNPSTGCTKISPGCKHCYAEAVANRFTNHFPNGFDFTLHPERLTEPLRWRRPCRIFVNSMSDLFHEDMPMEFLWKVFDTIKSTPQHQYQILTKRHERLLEMAGLLDIPPNAWIGVSVESQDYVERIDYLREVKARVRFVSFEPLLGPVRANLTGIHWIIVGGESGRNHRPIDADWVRSLRDQASSAGVAFFFKQWGGANSKAGGRELDDRTWSEMPQMGVLPVKDSIASAP